MAASASFTPVATSLIATANGSRIWADFGWNQQRFITSPSAPRRLASAASAAWGPKACLNPSEPQAEARGVARPRAAAIVQVGRLVAQARKRKAAGLFCDFALMPASQCHMLALAGLPALACGMAP